MMRHTAIALIVISAFAGSLSGQSPVVALKSGAKVYIAEMPDGFDTYLKSALIKKKVPLSVVGSKDDADFEITGTSESQKAGAAKKLLRGSFHSDEQASISIAHIKSGEIVFAYSVNKKDSLHGKQSTAEACAVHIKDELDNKK